MHAIYLVLAEGHHTSESLTYPTEYAELSPKFLVYVLNLVSKYPYTCNSKTTTNLIEHLVAVMSLVF